MSFMKDLKERLTETEYVYIVHEKTKNVLEINSLEQATAYANVFGDTFKVYNHFPYAEYGYEDPYAFTNEWTVSNSNGDTIKYEWDESIGAVTEVHV